jgi:hypothetical protein
LHDFELKHLVSASSNLQNFHFESVHPPNVCVKNQVVDILPINTMFINWFRHDYPIQDAVHVWIVWIWLNQKWGPIELHCRIIVLRENKKKNIRTMIPYFNIVLSRGRSTFFFLFFVGSSHICSYDKITQCFSSKLINKGITSSTGK